MRNKSAFDDLTVFDALELTAFDEVDLPPEDKILYSKELDQLIKQEIKQAIISLPIGKMISEILEKNSHENEKIKKLLSKNIQETKNELQNNIAKFKEELSGSVDKLKKRYDELKTERLNATYQLGGFPLAADTYSVSNVTPTKTYNATSTSVDELASVLGTLIATLRTSGLIK